MARKKQTAKAALPEEEASFHLLDEWLQIENEHTNPGFILPGREAVIGWIEAHAAASLLVAGVAVFVPVIGALAFG